MVIQAGVEVLDCIVVFMPLSVYNKVDKIRETPSNTTTEHSLKNVP